MDNRQPQNIQENTKKADIKQQSQQASRQISKSPAKQFTGSNQQIKVEDQSQSTVSKITNFFKNYLPNKKNVLDFPNYRFYKNEYTIKQKLSIQKILNNYYDDYEWLEDQHDYIQWVFPNLYQSRFNSNSYPLTKEEASKFRTDKQIGERLERSFKMYCNFIGIKINIQQSIYQIDPNRGMQRLMDALVRHTHNHLRIRRILACLSVTGFRVYALWMIYILQKFIMEINPLKRNKYLIQALQTEWKIYSDQQLKSASENCFVEKQVFEQLNPHLKIEICQRLKNLCKTPRGFINTFKLTNDFFNKAMIKQQEFEQLKILFPKITNKKQNKQLLKTLKENGKKLEEIVKKFIQFAGIKIQSKENQQFEIIIDDQQNNKDRIQKQIEIFQIMIDSITSINSQSRWTIKLQKIVSELTKKIQII